LSDRGSSGGGEAGGTEPRAAAAGELGGVAEPLGAAAGELGGVAEPLGAAAGELGGVAEPRGPELFPGSRKLVRKGLFSAVGDAVGLRAKTETRSKLR